jgi:hypothetical protein
VPCLATWRYGAIARLARRVDGQWSAAVEATVRHRDQTAMWLDGWPEHFRVKWPKMRQSHRAHGNPQTKSLQG